MNSFQLKINYDLKSYGLPFIKKMYNFFNILSLIEIRSNIPPHGWPLVVIVPKRCFSLQPITTPSLVLGLGLGLGLDMGQILDRMEPRHGLSVTRLLSGSARTLVRSRFGSS